MHDGGPVGHRRVSFSLRLKITLTFLLVSAVVSGLLSFTVYRILNDGLLRQMQSRVLALSQVGAKLVNVDSLGRLVGLLGAPLGGDRVALIEGSPDFRVISDALNSVRSIEGRLVHYIYVFTPTADPLTALYVVDGDVLPALEKQARGEGAAADLSHFGSPFDMTGFPVPRRTLAEHRALVESAWSRDPEFHVNSLSGYAPILGRQGEVLGVLGIDMVDTDVQLILSGATRVTLLVIAGALALTVASSIVLSTLFTRGIVSLDKVVQRFDGKNMDARADVRSRDEVGRLGVSFNAMADTLQRYSGHLEALLSAYGRFVPQKFLGLLKKGSILDVKLGDQTEKEMAVLFSDIVGFTTLSETMSPFENFNFLNSFLRRMGPKIRDAGGFIDKYIGDGIMALFPEKPDDAFTAAVGMQEALVEYNVHRGRSGYKPITIGIGLNVGKLMLGTVGEQERMDGSVISDAVNLCSRLQGLTRVYNSSILTTGQTLKMLAAPTRFRCRFIDRVRVRGKKETILLFEVLDGEPPAQRDRKLSYRSEFAQALRLYYGRSFAEALEIIKRLVRENPEDEILRIYRKRCELHVNLGTPKDWEGVEVFDSRH
jgi:class 3 adenylate cyclase